MSSCNWREYLKNGYKASKEENFAEIDLMYPDDPLDATAYLPKDLHEEVNGVRFTKYAQPEMPENAFVLNGVLVVRPQKGATLTLAKKKSG